MLQIQFKKKNEWKINRLRINNPSITKVFKFNQLILIIRDGSDMKLNQGTQGV